MTVTQGERKRSTRTRRLKTAAAAAATTTTTTKQRRQQQTVRDAQKFARLATATTQKLVVSKLKKSAFSRFVFRSTVHRFGCSLFVTTQRPISAILLKICTSLITPNPHSPHPPPPPTPPRVPETISVFAS